MRILGINFAKPNLYWLLPFVFLTLYCHRYLTESSAVIFILSCVSIIPLAALLSDATNEIAEKAGDAIGGFLNATLGNAPEFIISIVALNAGQISLVKATLTGAIIGNILLVLGLSFFVGGIKHKVQSFNKLGAESLSIGLIIAIIALILPATYAKFAANTPNIQYIQLLSNVISITLLIIYLASVIFSLITHRNILVGTRQKGGAHGGTLGWSLITAIIMLFCAAGLIALMSEILVKHVEHAAKLLGISKVFIGVIVVAIVGNAAEHSTSVIMAIKNKLDISIVIAIGSSTQIALLIVPTLVLLSTILPVDSMDLIFTNGEILLIFLSVFILSQMVAVGESTWYKGFQLLGVYTIIGMALYFVH